MAILLVALMAMPILANAQTSPRDKEGNTLLIKTAETGNVALATNLIAQYPGDISEPNDYGTTPLIAAGESGSKDMVILLMAHGAKLTEENEVGVTILHTAAVHGHLKLVEFLLGYDELDVHTTTVYGGTALHYAANGGSLEVVEYLWENYDWEPEELVKDDGSTLLHSAVQGNQADVQLVKYLVETVKVNPNATRPRRIWDEEADDLVEIGRVTALDIARGYENEEVIKYLETVTDEK